MSSEWEETTLGDILTLQRGMDLPIQKRKEGIFPVVASTGIVGFHNEGPVKGPGVVIGRSGSIGGGQYLENDFWPLNTTLWVKNFKQNNPKFCYYLLRSIDFSGLNAGSGVPTLNRNHLHPMWVRKPPIDEQILIGEFLSTLDDRIALLRKTRKTLETIAQAIFKSWFVDFDPVRAKMEGRQPEGMDEETAASFPDSFEESELGLIPRGWKAGSLDDLSSLNPESWTTKNHPERLLYVDLANTKDNVISEISEFAFEDAPSRARRVLRSGDTVVGTVRPGNRSFAFVNSELENLTGSTGFAVLRPITEAAAEFVYLSATQDSSIEYLTHVADGGAYPAVRPDVVSNLACVIPSEEILNNFHDMAVLLFESVANNQMRIETLGALRDALLPRLISGRIRLPDAEQKAEAVLS